MEGFSLTDQEERKAIYDQIMEKVMSEYTGLYYAYECRNWAVSPKVHDARLRADSQVLVATSVQQRMAGSRNIGLTRTPGETCREAERSHASASLFCYMGDCHRGKECSYGKNDL